VVQPAYVAGVRTVTIRGSMSRANLKRPAPSWPFGFLDMKEVYFDTNVYDLLDEQVQAKDVGPINNLRRAIRSDQLRVYTNLVPIEETLGALRNHPAEGGDDSD